MGLLIKLFAAVGLMTTVVGLGVVAIVAIDIFRITKGAK